jgi:hypothetical protein
MHVKTRANFLQLTPDFVTAFQIQELDSRTILKEVVNSPTAFFPLRLSFLMNASFYANHVQPLAVMHANYNDATCTTSSASSADSPNPLVANLGQCTKLSSKGPVILYYKPVSCLSGKAEGRLFADAACAVPIHGAGVMSTETDKCLPSAGGGFEKVTCAFGPMANQTATSREPVVQKLSFSFNTDHLCASSHVTRGCLLKNISFASGECLFFDYRHSHQIFTIRLARPINSCSKSFQSNPTSPIDLTLSRRNFVAVLRTAG